MSTVGTLGCLTEMRYGNWLCDVKYVVKAATPHSDNIFALYYAVLCCAVLCCAALHCKAFK